jgi:hypothetical protein
MRKTAMEHRSEIVDFVAAATGRLVSGITGAAAEAEAS